jgi:hypothetical protein
MEGWKTGRLEWWKVGISLTSYSHSKYSILPNIPVFRLKAEIY